MLYPSCLISPQELSCEVGIIFISILQERNASQRPQTCLHTSPGRGRVSHSCGPRLCSGPTLPNAIALFSCHCPHVPATTQRLNVSEDGSAVHCLGLGRSVPALPPLPDTLSFVFVSFLLFLHLPPLEWSPIVILDLAEV